MKVILLGKKGMLGSQFDEKIRKSFSDKSLKLFSFDHSELDITDFKEVERTFDDIKPDIVINCVAYTGVDDSEYFRKEAYLLNAKVPGKLAELCHKNRATLIHFSTDYVFDGHKKSPISEIYLSEENAYPEKNVPNPLSYYGESKFQGEELIIKNLKNFYIIRTSWLYGKRIENKGRNFVDTMMKLGKEVVTGKRSGLKVVGDQVGSPTLTNDLAEAVLDNFVRKMMGKDTKNDAIPLFGIYHLTNSGFCSWYEFAVKIFEIAKLKVPVEKITTKEYPLPAPRPKNSILLNTKLSPLRRWDEALKDYISKEY